MEITYDPAKNEKNIRERGLDFERASNFEFGDALTRNVLRHGEWRLEALGYLEGRLHLLCYKVNPIGIRVISFRKANEREAKRNGYKLRR